jgi:carnitine 3-dehydrogenase
MVDGCDAEAAGRSIAELVAERDRAIIAVQRAVAQARRG